MNTEKPSKTDEGQSRLTVWLGMGFGYRHMTTKCNRCDSVLSDKNRWAGAYSCETCNSWTLNVRHEPVSLFSNCNT